MVPVRGQGEPLGCAQEIGRERAAVSVLGTPTELQRDQERGFYEWQCQGGMIFRLKTAPKWRRFIATFEKSIRSTTVMVGALLTAWPRYGPSLSTRRRQIVVPQPLREPCRRRIKRH